MISLISCCIHLWDDISQKPQRQKAEKHSWTMNRLFSQAHGKCGKPRVNTIRFLVFVNLCEYQSSLFNFKNGTFYFKLLSRSICIMDKKESIKWPFHWQITGCDIEMRNLTLQILYVLLWWPQSGDDMTWNDRP